MRVRLSYLLSSAHSYFRQFIIPYYYRGGIANRVYHCSIKEPLASQITDEPKDVIVRLHGSEILRNIGKPKLIGDAAECIIFFCLSLNNMGPRLLGLFQEGRIEEYIPVRSLVIFTPRLLLMTSINCVIL